jgi:hypothetical protein
MLQQFEACVYWVGGGFEPRHSRHSIHRGKPSALWCHQNQPSSFSQNRLSMRALIVDLHRDLKKGGRQNMLVSF